MPRPKATRPSDNWFTTVVSARYAPNSPATIGVTV